MVACDGELVGGWNIWTRGWMVNERGDGFRDEWMSVIGIEYLGNLLAGEMDGLLRWMN